jgi:protein-S-isoprenylcysteine O-methyltransferase Ste14
MTEVPGGDVPTAADNAAVIVRPPFLYIGAFVAVLLLRAFRPLPILDRPPTRWLGVFTLLLGLALAVRGRRELTAAGTNVSPSRPATTIVSSGPYRLSRNPLYVALTLLFIGLTLAFDTWWGFVVLVPVLIVMHFGVVVREERYLTKKFGESYRQYRANVRRYL